MSLGYLSVGRALYALPVLPASYVHRMNDWRIRTCIDCGVKKTSEAGSAWGKEPGPESDAWQLVLWTEYPGACRTQINLLRKNHSGICSSTQSKRAARNVNPGEIHSMTINLLARQLQLMPNGLCSISPVHAVEMQARGSLFEQSFGQLRTNLLAKGTQRGSIITKVFQAFA